MNIEQAKVIPLPTVLERMRAPLSRQNDREAWYYSPLRQERTASLHVHLAKNVWYDFGEGKGGDGLALVCAYLAASGEGATVVDALRWLGNMTGGSFPPLKPSGFRRHFEAEKGWLLKSAKPIEHLALIRYLERRGIPLPLAQRYLKQVSAKNLQTGRGILALGLRNEEGGYELRNPFFKSSISPKTISFIRGPTPKPASIHVFEGMLDFLSAAAECPAQELDGDAIVLNSVSNLKDAVPYIKGYGYQTLFSWMDNDPAGEKARQTLYQLARHEPGLLHQPQNALCPARGRERLANAPAGTDAHRPTVRCSGIIARGCGQLLPYRFSTTGNWLSLWLPVTKPHRITGGAVRSDTRLRFASGSRGEANARLFIPTRPPPTTRSYE